MNQILASDGKVKRKFRNQFFASLYLLLTSINKSNVRDIAMLIDPELTCYDFIISVFNEFKVFPQEQELRKFCFLNGIPSWTYITSGAPLRVWVLHCRHLIQDALDPRQGFDTFASTMRCITTDARLALDADTEWRAFETRLLDYISQIDKPKSDMVYHTRETLPVKKAPLVFTMHGPRPVKYNAREAWRQAETRVLVKQKQQEELEEEQRKLAAFLDDEKQDRMRFHANCTKSKARFKEAVWLNRRYETDTAKSDSLHLYHDPDVADLLRDVPSINDVPVVQLIERSKPK